MELADASAPGDKVVSEVAAGDKLILGMASDSACELLGSKKLGSELSSASLLTLESDSLSEATMLVGDRSTVVSSTEFADRLLRGGMLPWNVVLPPDGLREGLCAALEPQGDKVSGKSSLCCGEIVEGEVLMLPRSEGVVKEVGLMGCETVSCRMHVSICAQVGMPDQNSRMLK